MTKREKAIAEMKAQLEAKREFVRLYVELAKACPTLSSDEVIALGDRLMELVAALPPKRRMRDEYSVLQRAVLELVHRHGYVLEGNPLGPQSLWKFMDERGRLWSREFRRIVIPELVPEDVEAKASK